MVMNQVNEGVFVACCYDYICDKMTNFMCKLRANGHQCLAKGKWGKQ
jgi:hypothetical protein